MFKGQHNERIYKLFREVVVDLNRQGITPVVYGSLGLSFLLGEKWPISDIDLLIEDSKEFETCRKISERHGFEYDPDHERELIGHGTFISFLDIKEIEKLINRKLDKELKRDQGIQYYILNAETYLKIYKKGLENKFRKQKKRAEDKAKIEDITSHLRGSHSK